MTKLRSVFVLAMAVSAAAAPFGLVRASQAPTGQAGGQEVLFGTIQGTVTREGTSTGIPDVQISVGIGPQQARAILDAANRGAAGIPPEILQAARGSGGGSGGGGGARAGQAPPLSAVTDSAGRFTITAPAGTVVVRAMLAGYFSLVPSGYSAFATAIATVGSEVATVHISLVPAGTINGRVTSPTGKPVANTTVGVLQQSYRNGVPTFDVVNGKSTDDRGEYRLFGLQPGSYYVVAAQPRPGFGPAAVVAGREVPVTTFYPSALDLASASQVAVRGGDDVVGMDIEIRTALTFRVTGRVTSTLPAGSEVSALNGQVRPTTPVIFLLPRGAGVLPAIDGGAAIRVSADGAFEIPSVVAGSYDLLARLPVSRGWGGQNTPDLATNPFAFGRTVIDVRSDLENVSVVVHQGVDLKGRVLVDGAPSAVHIWLSLQPDDDTPNFLPMFDQISSFAPVIEADGSFLFPLVPEARYRLQSTISDPIVAVPPPGARGGPAGALPPAPPKTLPATAYVADVIQGGTSVYDNGLTVGADPLDPIDVVIATDGIAVDGVVLGSDRQPVAGVLVALVPAANRRQNPALFQTARTNLLGRFSMTRVPPGAYTALAWDVIVPGAYQNPEFIRKCEARGIPVNARAGSAVTGLTLTVISVQPPK